MKNYVIHLGYSGFPNGNAAMQRIKMTFKSLKGSGFNILIISKKSINEHANSNKRIQRYEGIPYVQTSILVNRPKSAIIRNLNKLSGLIGEFKIILRLKNKVHSALVYTPSFYELVYYKIISLFFNFKVVLVYVEFRSAIPERQKGLKKINDFLFDHYCHHFCNSSIVISEFLKDHLIKKSPNLPIIKIPAITDFNEFKGGAQKVIENDYLMYCGTINYLDVILFIVDVFTKLKYNNEFKGQLILIVSGNHKINWDKLKFKIEASNLKEFIIIHSNISFESLIGFYLGAEALLIPLRDSVQDIARFPHKISEYTAAAKPIISTNIGELKHYFENYKSAILSPNYCVDSYYHVLQNVISNKNKLREIGLNGYKIGKDNFDYEVYNKELKDFINLN